ncbi:MAG TPA: glycerol-3-phosphate 1-O-acyltransferase PlsY [Candidatus Gemmiger stercorigallinarum]|nr:glycerol-3-phosphate 1-O-acyltransferase PlsY [Candidatus Gemmiger stercorigallinarum]
MGFKLIAACILVAAEAYLLGSIVFGILISKHFCHDDVRTHGSGSAGMTNMLRNYGKAAGAATAVGDVAKGAVAVLLGRLIFAWLLAGTGIEPVCGAYLAGIFAVIGHTLPVYFGFKGGKGVLVGAGAILATSPVVVLALLIIFLIEFAITRIVSLGSIIVAGLYPILAIVYWAWQGANLPSLVFIGVCAAIMGGMVIYMHRSNIQRLKDGTEYRFTKKK